MTTYHQHRHQQHRDRSPLRTGVRVTVAGLACAVLLGACGDDETAGPTTTTTTETVAIDVPDGPKPTVVLVHGAFADAAGWSAVAQRLLDLGFPVVAPANPLRGLASDAAYLRTFLGTIEGPIVLVGHSYGGMVMTNAALDDPDVTDLVYVAAFAPDEGDTVGGLLAEHPGSTLGGEALVLEPYPLPDGTEGSEGYVAPDAFHDVFAGDLTEEEAQILALTQRPGSSATLTEPSGPPAWASIPTSYLVATEDDLIPPDAQRAMAERADAEVVEVEASHLAMVSQPDAVVELIVAAFAAA